MERTLLLVDDEENITSALVRLLRRDGYHILRANSGEAGLDIAGAKRGRRDHFRPAHAGNDAVWNS